MNEKLVDLINEFIYGHLLEVGGETTDKWIKILSEKRLDSFHRQHEDNPAMVFKTKKEKIAFEKYFTDEFISQTTDYRSNLRKAKSEEEKEQVRTKNVKRKK